MPYLSLEREINDRGQTVPAEPLQEPPNESRLYWQYMFILLLIMLVRVDCLDFHRFVGLSWRILHKSAATPGKPPLKNLRPFEPSS
jgi:hypothetical protein